MKEKGRKKGGNIDDVSKDGKSSKEGRGGVVAKSVTTRLRKTDKKFSS